MYSSSIPLSNPLLSVIGFLVSQNFQVQPSGVKYLEMNVFNLSYNFEHCLNFCTNLNIINILSTKVLQVYGTSNVRQDIE